MPKITHGEAGRQRTPEYDTWAGMHRRAGRTRWYFYVSVCVRWRKYENFLADMGRRPTPLHTIERKNGRKGYTPKNCCWATRKEQSQNLVHTKRLTFDGKTQSVALWAAEIGTSAQCIFSRLKQGWPVDLAVSIPTRWGKTNILCPKGHWKKGWRECRGYLLRYCITCTTQKSREWKRKHRRQQQ